MSFRSRNTTRGAERAPKSKSKSPADAATSNGAVPKPGKGSKRKGTPAIAQLHQQIPAGLRSLPQWVVSSPNGRPLNARTGRNAMSNNPKTWATFDEVIEACATHGAGYLPAFALTEADPFCIVDLDDKADKPASADARRMFDHIVSGLDSYTERSRGGRGIHVVVRAAIDAPLKTAHVEIFDRAHFITLTGDVIDKAKPVREGRERIGQIISTLRPSKSLMVHAAEAGDSEDADEAVIDRASSSPATGSKFAALHRGEWDRLGIGDGSQSAADLAYVGMLWGASGNADQVTRLWLASLLAERAKGQRADYIARMLNKVTQSPPRMLGDDGPASLFSDTANAHRIVHHMGEWLMYVPGIGWHVWDGARWNPDPLEARRRVGKLGRIIVGESATILERAARIDDRDRAERERELAEKLLKYAGQTENVAKIEAALKAAEPLLRCDAGKLDADPYLLGCTNGVVDLRTSELLPPASDQLISRSTGHAFDAQATCSAWRAFLARIFRKHSDLPAFVQRLAGYWLTGLTDPPYLTVLYGTGANGKSTLISALSHAMGDYASSAPPGLLMARYGDRHPTELAALQGRRFVAAAESGEGGRLDEERIKALTGSDPITARRMREDFYTFNPTHNFALMTNHKPIVRGVDEGIWRRLLLVPFDEVIPVNERDTALASKLRDEAPGILAWAVEGARLFLSEGLRLPDVVASATATYRTESDVLGAFVTEECEVAAKATILSSQLYAAYEQWCDESGERALPKRTLGLRLQERGFTPAKDARSQRMWKGLRLRDQAVKKYR